MMMMMTTTTTTVATATTAVVVAAAAAEAIICSFNYKFYVLFAWFSRNVEIAIAFHDFSSLPLSLSLPLVGALLHNLTRFNFVNWSSLFYSRCPAAKCINSLSKTNIVCCVQQQLFVVYLQRQRNAHSGTWPIEREMLCKCFTIDNGRIQPSAWTKFGFQWEKITVSQILRGAKALVMYFVCKSGLREPVSQPASAHPILNVWQTLSSFVRECVCVSAVCVCVHTCDSGK